MSALVRIRFPATGHAELELPPGAELSEVLTAANSPVLFGCRTGICGTCACLAAGAAPPPDEEELEVLDACAPGVAGARLACQLRPEGDLELRPLPGEG